MNKEITDKILEYLSNAESFVKDQVPDFINQYLTWCFYSNVFFIILGFTLFLIPLFVYLVNESKNKGKTREYNRYGNPENFPTIVSAIFLILSIFAFGVFFIMATVNTYDLIKIKVAPKVYLVDKFVEKVK